MWALFLLDLFYVKKPLHFGLHISFFLEYSFSIIIQLTNGGQKKSSPSTGWVWVSKNEIATKWVRYRRIYWWHSLPPSTSMLHPMHALFTVAPPYPRPQTMLKLDDVICFLLPPWLQFHRRRIPKQTFSKVENSLLSVIYTVYSKFLSSWIEFSSGYLKKSKENKAKNEKEVISVHVQR